jgi:hypothetical protein
MHIDEMQSWKNKCKWYENCFVGIYYGDIELNMY